MLNKMLSRSSLEASARQTGLRLMSTLTTSRKDGEVEPNSGDLQFSKAPIMQNYGELPFGEIPEPLKRVNEFKMTTASNGIRVATETTNSNLGGVGVFINAGSRYETLETSGTANMLARLRRHASATRSATDLRNEVSSMGAETHNVSGREQTEFAFKTHKDSVGKATELLFDVVSGTNISPATLEAERELVRAQHESSHTEYERTLLENAHFNSFRDHMLGQPTRGDIDNLNQISIEDLESYQRQNWVGDNIVVVGTGNVSHDQLVDQVEQHLSSIPKSATEGRPNGERAVYTPSLLFIRDDEMVNSNVGVFFDAPGKTHEDYFSFQLLQRIFGDYNIQKNAEHLNDVLKQYNALHTMMGDLPDVTK